MALLFMDGFDVADASVKWAGSSGSDASTRFSSGRAVNINGSSIKRIIPAAPQIFSGFAIKLAGYDSGNGSYVSFWGDNGATQHITVHNTVNGTQVRLGGSNGTILASYGVALTLSTWYYFEISLTIADAGGTCLVKINGTTVVNFTGDTKNGGTNTTVDAISLGNTGYGGSFDDLYVCDASGAAPYNTFLGDARVATLSPTGAGSSTQLTPDSGSNYARVNEAPYSAVNYVSGATPGLRDTYTLSDLPAGTATVFAIQHNVIAKRTSTGAIAVKPAIKSGASVYYGSPTPTITNDTTISDLRTTDPNTSAAWTVSAVNALESGLEIA
jgi:hypothetical protein